MKEKTHILVVDDDQDILHLLERTLQIDGYSVDVATDGGSALNLLTKHKPGLVLLDILMPGLDGYQVLSIIRQRSDIPVIMVTGVVEAKSVVQAVNLGADDYVRKPFSIKELLARVKTKLKRAE